jgi:hypothetical protein
MCPNKIDKKEIKKIILIAFIVYGIGIALVLLSNYIDGIIGLVLFIVAMILMGGFPIVLQDKYNV